MSGCFELEEWRPSAVRRSCAQLGQLTADLCIKLLLNLLQRRNLSHQLLLLTLMSCMKHPRELMGIKES